MEKKIKVVRYGVEISECHGKKIKAADMASKNRKIEKSRFLKVHQYR